MSHFLICFILFLLSLSTTLSTCSSRSKQHVYGEFRRMHLVTQMSHTSSGLHASPLGWMNERAERLAGGGTHWQRQHGLCQLLNVIKKVSLCWSQGLKHTVCAVAASKPVFLLCDCLADNFDQA